MAQFMSTLVERTTSAQKGIYIVYLLNKDAKELYLTLKIAATEVMKPETDDGSPKRFVGVVGKLNKRVIEALKAKADAIRSEVKDQYFQFGDTIRSGAEGYNAGATNMQCGMRA